MTFGMTCGVLNLRFSWFVASTLLRRSKVFLLQLGLGNNNEGAKKKKNLVYSGRV